MGAVMSYDVLHVHRVEVEGRLLLEVLLVDADILIETIQQGLSQKWGIGIPCIVNIVTRK